MNLLFLNLIGSAMALASGGVPISGTHPLTRPQPISDPQLATVANTAIPSAGNSTTLMAAPGETSRLRGYTHKYPYGLQSIPMHDGQQYQMLCDDVSATYGGVEANGVYYAVDRMAYGAMTPYYMAFDTDTWNVLRDEDATYEILADDLTYDPTTGNIYGCFFTSSEPAPDKRMFGTVDFSTGQRTDIAEISVPWNAIAADSNGVIYVIDTYGVLQTVDKTNGALTRIGDTGLKPKYLSSAAFDFDSGKLYYILSDDAGCVLYEIDTRTARATERMVYEHDQEITGIYFVSSHINEKAPAAVASLTADFADGADFGYVWFNVPPTLYDGSPASGDVDAEIKVNGETVATVATTYGATEKVEISMPLVEAEITVTLINEAGRGPASSIFFSPALDTPEAPAAASAVYNNGTVTISWQPVGRLQDGTELNPSEVSYRVVRYPGNVTVADGISATNCVDNIGSPYDHTVYKYGVSATFKGKTGRQSLTNSIALGAYDIDDSHPYENNFDSEDSLEALTLIDANSDDFAWTLKDGAAYLPFAYATPGDDWLILPAMRLEKNRAYRLRMNAYGFSTECTESVEVKAGKQPSVAAMQTVVVEPTSFRRNSTAPLLVEGYLFPNEDGIFHIGIHGISEPNQWGLYIDDVKVERLQSAGVPREVSSLKVIPDFDGLEEASISFTLPTLDIEGEPLPSLSKALVMRDNVVVKEFENPLPGAEIEWTDRSVKTGEHLYEILAATEAGEGRISAQRVFVGINMPAFPTEVVARETEEGTVTISWNAPESDIDGYPINQSLISYRVAEVVGGYVSKYVAQDLKTTEFSYQFLLPGSEQQMMQWAVEAYTSAGSRSGIPTDMLSVGRPYEMPFSESFADGKISHPIGAINLEGKGAWTIHNEEFSIYPSQDADGGFIAMYGIEGGESQGLFTGKVLVEGQHPILTYWIGNFHDENLNSLLLQIDCGSGWNDIRLDRLSDLPETGWNLIHVDLADFAGKQIRLRFVGNIINYNYLPLDNISIRDSEGVDLAAGNLIMPSGVTIGEEFDIRVPVTNIGSLLPEQCRVKVYENGEMVASVPFEAPSCGERKEIAVGCVAKVILPHSESSQSVSASYLAEVEADGDFNPGNNKTPESILSFKLNSMPSPSGVAASETMEGFHVSWNAPDLSKEPHAVVEDFESHVPFAVNDVPGWRFVDGDGGLSTGFSNSEFPGMNSRMAYILLDTSYEGFNGNSYASHSGTKHLAAFAAPFEEQNDDWAILPLLSGNAQQVSFFAKSYGGVEYPESFEVYVSTDVNAASQQDFTLLDGPMVAAPGWTKYSFDVPQGTRRFAIRYMSSNQFVLFIDDVAYEAAGPGDGVNLLGYNIYLDHKKAGECQPGTLGVDIKADASVAHHIAVSAVYDLGESAASCITTVPSSVDSAAADGIRIWAAAHSILICSDSEIHASVCTPAGLSVGRAEGKGLIRFDVEPGLYIVRAGNHSVKLTVK